ncbi:hypothetical protein B0H19DRAFT_1261610 [Mycena capillaripes]|nr:hypothetical protein B0H19DRAFT_1261610 [Mycena capillaripes]
MFNHDSRLSIVAAEVTHVGGTFYRFNSPTEVTFTNASLSSYGSNLAVPLLSPPPSGAQHLTGTGSGMFTGAFNFSVAAAEVLSVGSDYERRDSGTRVTMGLAQLIPAPHAQRRNGTIAAGMHNARQRINREQPRGRDYGESSFFSTHVHYQEQLSFPSQQWKQLSNETADTSGSLLSYRQDLAESP